MTMVRSKVAAYLAVTLVLSLLTVTGAEAQEDTWSFVFTPQVWFENVRNNGFGPAATTLGGSTFQVAIGGSTVFARGTFSPETFTTGSTEPTSMFFPQWGGQFAAQHGRWTFGVGAQYVSFETVTDFYYNGATFGCALGPAPSQQGTCSSPLVGSRLATEIVRTDRVDVDLTASYFFPDVIKDTLDVSAGLGIKWIRASGHRTLSVAPGDIITSAPVYQFADGSQRSNKASFLDNLYGVTIPTSLNFQLSRDGNWLLPLTVTPFIGHESRSDQVNGDKSSFAYGGTFDLGIRYVFANGVGVYGGWRGQVIQGNDLFFAQGPLFNVSVRFGK